MKLIFTSGLLAAVTWLAIAAPIPKDKEPLAPPTEKELAASRDNLKSMGIALHGHNDAFARLPADIPGKDGKPALSWRVQILPYVDEDELYKQFKLDEPWDSKHNKALIEKIPKIYAPIRVKAEKGLTFYRGYNGADTTFEAGKQLAIPRSFPDGTSNTIAIVEAGEACIWTKPDDVLYDAKKPLPKLGGLFEGDFHVLLMDGSVTLGHTKTMDADQFRKMVTRSDGQNLDPDQALGLEKKK